MKSSYELAMERLGGSLKQYSDEQKEQLAEVDRKYDAKVAQARLDADARLATAAGDSAKRDQIREDLAVELASCNQRRDRAKQKLREEFDSA